MATIEPKALSQEDHAYYADTVDRRLDRADEAALWAHVLWLEQREAHVIEVLREAQRNNGGYGFVRQLLQYLGATEVGA